jgi:hypothetical protein
MASLYVADLRRMQGSSSYAEEIKKASKERKARSFGCYWDLISLVFPSILYYSHPFLAFATHNH